MPSADASLLDDDNSLDESVVGTLASLDSPSLDSPSLDSPSLDSLTTHVEEVEAMNVSRAKQMIAEADDDEPIVRSRPSAPAPTPQNRPALR